MRVNIWGCLWTDFAACQSECQHARYKGSGPLAKGAEGADKKVMPLLTVQTSAPVERSDAETLLLELSTELATGLAKPEAYVATSLVAGVAMTFGGSVGPSCLVEVASIGTLSGSQTERLSRSLCQLLSERLSVPKERTYVRFSEVERHLWGHSGGSFA